MSARRILIVEDELVVGLDLEKRIRDMGIDVIAVVPSGRDALEEASRATPDLVLMDIKLSGEMDGIETARRLHERVPVPIVFVTAFADAATTARVKAIAPYGYVVKPFQRDALRAVIESALSRAEVERRLQASERALALAHESERTLRTRLQAVDHAGVAVANALAAESSDFVNAELLQVFVEEARAITRAEYAALGIVGAPGQPFIPWVFSGLDREQAASIGRPPGPVGLLGEVIELGRSIRLADLHEHAAFRGFPPLHPAMKAFLGVPILYRGASRGNLYLANSGARGFTQEDQDAIEMLVERFAIALEVGRLRQIEARERARLGFLAKAGPALAGSLDYETTLVAIGALIVPSIAELCTLHLVDESGASRLAIARHSEPGKQEALERLLDHRRGTPGPPRLAGGADLVSDMTDELLELTAVRDPADREVVRQLAPGSGVVVPLVLRGETIGVLRMGAGASRAPFGQEDLSLVQEVAHLAAFAITNARLYQATERHEEEQRFLAEVGAALASSRDYEETLTCVARLAVQRLADWCLVDLLDDRELGSRSTVVHADPGKAAACEALRRIPLERRRPHLAFAAQETKRPLLVSEVQDGYLESIAQGEEHLRALQELGARSYMALPLLARERLLGVLVLVSTERTRRYGAEDLRLAQELAHRAALAVENARLFHIAQRAIHARDDVTAIVSHDLKSPLATIRLGLGLLSRRSATDEAGSGRKEAHIIQRMERSLTRLEELIRSLNDATMIETGQFTVESRPEDVAALLGEAASVLEPQAEARDLRLTLDVAKGLPSVDCDRARLLQAVGNLVGNAIKFTEKGGRIGIAARPLDGGIHICVSDTGVGISERHVPFIFQRYWKGKERNQQGTGLGLYITKGIVDAHGGRIWVESKLQEGSAFHITLPASSPVPETRGGEASLAS